MTKQKASPIISIISLAVFPIWWLSRMWQINKFRKSLVSFLLMIAIVVATMYIGKNVSVLDNALGLIAIFEILVWIAIMAYFTNRWVDQYNKSIESS